MKSKKLFIPMLILIGGLLATVIVNLAVCVAMKPTVTEQEFPFSITYEYQGKTETYRGVYACTYTGNSQSVDPLDRFYDGRILGVDSDRFIGDILLHDDSESQLVIITGLDAGYLMGDPQHEDREDYDPYIAYFDAEGVEHSDEETLAAKGVKLIGWEFPSPIECKLTFSHLTRLHSGCVIPTVLVGILTILLCVILVKREEGLDKGLLYQTSVIFNFLAGFVALPILVLLCSLLDVNGDGSGLVYQVCYCVPAITALGIAASVALRRKGYAVSGFIAQFIGPAIFALALLGEVVATIIAH